MIVLQSEARVARRIDGALLGAAMLALTFGLAAGLWGRAPVSSAPGAARSTADAGASS